MQREPEIRRKALQRLREAWLTSSMWSSALVGTTTVAALGRCPLRPAIRAETSAIEPRSRRSIEEAREELGAAVASWPATSPRLGIEGDTGLGKTTLAVRRCADHVIGPALVDGAILFVARDRERVYAVLAEIRADVSSRGGDPSAVTELLGRQRVGADGVVPRFGCRDYERAHLFGTKGRRVEEEVCGACVHRERCLESGYLRHTKDALGARVVICTAAKLRGISKEEWSRITGVVCDEDVLPGLLSDLSVSARELARHEAGLRRPNRHSPRARAWLPAAVLVAKVRAVMKTAPAGARALVGLLPEDCDRFATTEGLRELSLAMPTAGRRVAGGETTFVSDPRAPALWERVRGERTPRQTWGRVLKAWLCDLSVGGGERCGAAWVVRAREGGRARLRIVRLDDHTMTALLARPLLVLDATLHPALAPLLRLEHREIRYDQRREIVQVLGPLWCLGDLRARVGDRWVLTEVGRRLVAQIAAWFEGRCGYILVRKALLPLIELEASRYRELAQAMLVSPGRERGWNADGRASVFVALGRHAKNAAACEREAHALRAASKELHGSTALIDQIESRSSAKVFRGRGVAVRYRGELVERASKRALDHLASALMDADAVATVRQFVGRDRTGHARVLLLRGDPTIGADALVLHHDLACATPAIQRRLVGGRTAV